tara:strand:- start:98 stop:1183 length:1086 start_codon:yes stop_codon:yes gene_type:complete
MANYKDIKYQFPTSSITSGTFADARISESSVTQHVTDTDLQPIKSDISALALREATNETSAAFNLPNQFIETFTDDTNLATQTNGDRVDGYWATIFLGSASYDSGDRSSTYTVSHTGTTESSVASSGLVDGNESSPDWTWANSTTQPTGVYVRFDRGSGNTAVYQGVKMIRQNTSKQAGTAWAFQGSQDASSWTDLLTGQEYGGSTALEYAFTGNTTAYRYIQWVEKSGSGVTTNNNCYDREWYFKIASVTSNATGTLIQSANTVGSAKTKVGGTMLYKDNEGTASLGTDLKIYFTCNGGTNWTEASSYNAITPVYSTGIKQVRLGETTCTSGTDIRYKAVWANQSSGSKDTQLHGLGINY